MTNYTTVGMTGGRSEHGVHCREESNDRKEQGILVSLPEGSYHLPASSSNIWGEWEQWDLALFAGDWRKEISVWLGDRGKNYERRTMKCLESVILK